MNMVLLAKTKSKNYAKELSKFKLNGQRTQIKKSKKGYSLYLYKKK